MKKIFSRKMNWISITIIAVLFVITFSLSSVYSNQQISFDNAGHTGEEVYYATISRVISDTANETGGRTVHMELYLLDGPYQNNSVSIIQELSVIEVHSLYPLRAGDNVIALRMETASSFSFAVIGFRRDSQMLIAIAAFFAMLILIGRWKGLKTVLSFATTALVVFGVFIPGILANKNIYLLISVSSLLITTLSFMLISGLSRKTFASIAGVLGGVIAASLLSVMVTQLFRIQGPISDEYTYLFMSSATDGFRFENILFAAVVIGSLGAIMDVALSIASSLEEIMVHKPFIRFAELFRSGMNIGFDAISTMVTTLVLAYLGGSLPTLLLMYLYQRSSTYVFNSTWIAVEVIQSIAGASGIVLAVPITIVSFGIVNRGLRNKKAQADVSEQLLSESTE